MPIVPYDPPLENGLTASQGAYTVADVLKLAWSLCYGCRVCRRPGGRFTCDDLEARFPPAATMAQILDRLTCKTCGGKGRGSFLADTGRRQRDDIARFEASPRSRP
jgi:hypothetical protein